MKSKLFTVRIDSLDPFKRLLVTDNPRPAFSLKLLENAPGLKGFRITLLNESGALVWERAITGLWAAYDGPPLSPKTAYRVRAEAQWDGGASGLEARFETGFLSEPWRAKWIEPEQLAAIREKKIAFDALFAPGADDGKVTERLRPAQQLTRTFSLAALPQRARLYATAHGIYELYVNGERLGDNRFAPETSVTFSSVKLV